MIAEPQRQQRSVAIATIAFVAALAAFAPHAIDAWQNDVSAWDERLSVAIHDAENRDTILDRYVDPFGLALHPVVTIAGIAAVLAVAFLRARRGERRLPLALLVGLVGAGLLVPMLKWGFARPPVDPGGDDEGGYAFPSGHALRSGVEALMLTAVAWSTRWRWPVASVSALVVVLIGVGVVYHEWHWASDVLGGWALAVAWLAVVWLVFRPSLSTPHRR